MLPPRVLARLKVGLGDELWIKEIPAGIELPPASPEETEQLRVMRKVMRDNHEVLKKLADS